MVNSFHTDLRIGKHEHLNAVGKIEYLHTQKNQSGTAYPSNEGVGLLLRIPRVIGAADVSIVIKDECCKSVVKRIAAYWYERDGNFDVFTVNMKKGLLKKGLYFFHIAIEGCYSLCGYKRGSNIIFADELESGEHFQLSVFDAIYNSPQKKYGGIIYHIFVDRFNRADNPPPREDAILIEDWYSDIPEYPKYPGAFLKNNTFFGGTLYGVIEKLEYLSELGVNTIYLSPVFEAYSNHKYDTGNYLKVDSMFGGDEALTKLISSAKEYNIGIILDGVFNHTGDDSIYFNRKGRYSSLGAYQSKDSKFYSWYKFQSHPEKYTSWWGIDILPRIHPDIPECRDFFIGNNGVIEKYAAMGIDGFRLDVADELSDSFIAGIKKALNGKNSSSVLYGEVWEDASNKIAYDTRKHYYLGDELDGVMNYPLRVGIIDYIKNKQTSALNYALNEVFFNMPKRIRDMAMNLLGTHDTERILTVLGGTDTYGKSNSELKEIRMTPEERATAIRRLKTAYTLVATLPGIPSVFYGDEAGMEGYSDPFNRRPYPWGKENRELLLHYRNVGRIRRNNDVYKEGEFKLLLLTEDILVFERINNGIVFLTVVNNSPRELELSFSKKCEELLSQAVDKRFLLKNESAVIIKTHDKNSFTYNFKGTEE